MPAVQLPWTEVNHNGAAPAAEVTGDPTNGHSAVNDGAVEIIVRNSSGTAARTVTFNFANTVDGQTVPGKATAIAIGVTRKFHGFPVALYGSTLSITVDNAELKLSAEHKVGVSN
jgi:hypothetical protein